MPKPDKRLYHLFLIKPTEIEHSSQPKQPDLVKIQRAVNGYIQEIPRFRFIEYKGVKYGLGIAYGNEEGILHKLPHNPLATRLWRLACPEGDPDRMNLFGNILFVGREPRK
jgi:hypothetical protein